MSDHPYAQAPNSKKPFLKISYYEYNGWLQLIDQDKLTRWESLRFKMMNERYFYGRALLQVPLMGASYLAAHFVWGTALRRRDSGFRDNLVFAAFFYVLFAHWTDKVSVPDRFLDELFTQSDPNGHYLKDITKEYCPAIWEHLKQQLVDKGFRFEEKEEEKEEERSGKELEKKRIKLV